MTLFDEFPTSGRLAACKQTPRALVSTDSTIARDVVHRPTPLVFFSVTVHTVVHAINNAVSIPDHRCIA